jgi:hypothetical protein
MEHEYYKKNEMKSLVNGIQDLDNKLVGEFMMLYNEYILDYTIGKNRK